MHSPEHAIQQYGNSNLDHTEQMQRSDRYNLMEQKKIII